MHFGMIAIPLTSHLGEGMHREIPFFSGWSRHVIDEAVVVLMFGTQRHLPEKSFEQGKENIRVGITEIERQSTTFGNLCGQLFAQVVGSALDTTVTPDGGPAVSQTELLEHGKHECSRLCECGVALAIAHANILGLFRHGSVQA